MIKFMKITNLPLPLGVKAFVNGVVDCLKRPLNDQGLYAFNVNPEAIKEFFFDSNPALNVYP